MKRPLSGTKDSNPETKRHCFAQAEKQWIGTEGIFSNPWPGTVLQIIPHDLHAIIDYYRKAGIFSSPPKIGINSSQDRPPLKPEYKAFIPQGLVSRFDSPHGIAIDRTTGYVFVAYTLSCNVAVYDGAFRTGASIIRWITGGTPSGKKFEPTALTLSGGDLFVVDRANCNIHKFDSTDWTPKGYFGGPGDQNGFFAYPSGITTDNDGHLLISDCGNDRIQRFTSQGKWIQSFGSFGRGRGQLRGPAGIAVDSKGNILVVETSGNRIQVFNPAGESIQIIGANEFQFPWGLTLSREDELLVCDTENRRILLFSRDGAILKQIETAYKGPHSRWNDAIPDGSLILPRGVVLDKMGNILVIDQRTGILIWE